MALPRAIDLAKQVLVGRHAEEEEHRMSITIAHFGLHAHRSQGLDEFLKPGYSGRFVCSPLASRHCH